MSKKLYASWGCDKAFKYKWQAKLQDIIFAFKTPKASLNAHQHIKGDEGTTTQAPK